MIINQLENTSFPSSLGSLMLLNLTYNRIESIQPDAFVHLTSLTELYLSNNYLKELKIASDLSSLEVLDLGENGLESVPSELNLKKLRKLSLLGNRITTVEENDFVHLTRLEYIDLSKNLIRSVSSQAFQYLNDLRVLNLATNSINKQSDLNFNLLRNQLQLDILDLSDNRINFFPFQLLINQKNLKKLYLDYNQIDELTNEMLQSLESVEELSISFNLINELKDGLFYYNQNLKLINLHANKIQSVNDNVFIGCSENLLGLDLSYNDLVELPRLVLPKLIILNLSLNQFKELNRNHFINLPSLLYLNLSNSFVSNELNQIPSSIFNYNKQLEFLDLSGNELESVEIGAFKNLSLIRINLSKNKLKELDLSTFEDLANLEHLDLSMNELIYIKNGAFYELPKLRTLNLSKNRLQSFRGELFSSTKTQLEILNLCDNSINYLYPASFNIHRKLKVLKICSNNLNYFPTEIINTIASLEEVDLSSNKLKSLDTNNFSNLQRLKILRLNNNYLTTIGPNAFYNLTRLSYLDLSANNLVSLDASSFRNVLRLNLNLANNELASIENEMFDLENVAILNELNIANNNFTDFPLDALRRQATNLMSLQIASNYISHLPTNTDLLINLKQLDISSNPLCDDALRILLTEPKSVKHLNVANTRISNFKFNTIEAPFIRHLNLSGNRLRSLNSSLFEKISLLEVLDLSGNALTDLKAFTDIWPLISNLRTLNLSSNLFRSVQSEDFVGLNSLVSLDLSNLNNLSILDCESIAKLKYLSELAIYNYTTLKNYEPQECFLNKNKLSKLSIEIKSGDLKGHLFNSYSTKLNQLLIYGPKLNKISPNFLFGIRSKHLDLTLFNTSLGELPLNVFSSLSLKCEIQLNLIASNELLFTSNSLIELNNKQLNVRINRLSNVSLPCDCSTIRAKSQFNLNGQRKSILLDSLIDQFDELTCNHPTALIGFKLAELDFNEMSCAENGGGGENASDVNYNLINKDNKMEKPDLVELSTNDPNPNGQDRATHNYNNNYNYNLNHSLNNANTNQFSHSTYDRASSDKVHTINQQNSSLVTHHTNSQDILLTKSSIRKNKNNLKLLKTNEIKSNQLSSLSFTKIDTIIIGSTVATIVFILVLMIICCFGMRVKTSQFDSSYYANSSNLFGQPLTVRNQSSLESNCTCLKASCHQSNHQTNHQTNHQSNHSPYSSSLNNSLLNFHYQNDLEPMTMFYMK